MTGEVVTLGHREFVQALALGGLRGWEVSSPEEALVAWKTVLKQEGVALILIPLWVEKALEEEVLARKLSKHPPLVLSLPNPLEGELGEMVANLSEYIRTSLGVKI
ncbi:MAG: V-type ATP synthase subunit F [Brevinematales bacterium]|nr:V-type ATP synthase subunit F [Brevinematales bacterium]